MGNYIEGTCKEFPSTNFSHFPTYTHGLHYLLIYLTWPLRLLLLISKVPTSLQSLVAQVLFSVSFLVFFLFFFFCIFSLTPTLLGAFISFFFLFFPFFFISSFFSSQILCYKFFFFFDFSSKIVWHKNFEGVPDILRVFLFFFKGKQIKKFKLLYIIFFFFSSQGVPDNILDSEWRYHWLGYQCSKQKLCKDASWYLCNVFMIYAINNLEAKFYVKGFDVLLSMFLQKTKRFIFRTKWKFRKKRKNWLTETKKILNLDYYVISITALIKISYWSLMH